MAGSPASWLLGEFRLTSDATITVNGGSSAVIPAGNYYIRDPSPGRSLIDVILTEVTPFMTTPAIFVDLNRRIRVTAGAAFTWAIPIELDAILGFGASIPLTSSAVATDPSTLLWSPGRPLTTVGHPTGTTGWESPTRIVTQDGSGQKIRTTLHGDSAFHTGLAWSLVLRERGWTDGFDDGKAGDYRRFWVDVLKPGFRFKHYALIPEVDGSAAAVSFPAPFGPYKPRELPGENYRRSIKNADTHSEGRLDATLTSELA